ncbi:MAG: T9SS type A sorting domain-containing protein [Flavobacteriales bacterium]|nr:T9SS type A sorting domain-containing protein [Flavobacteriales bacterium]
MRGLFYFGVLLLSLISAYGQNCQPDEDKVLLIGDSWASFSWNANSLEENLNQFGYSNFKMYTNLDITEAGKTVREFKDSSKINAIHDALLNHPTIEIVNISLGGNDLLDDWDTTMSLQTTDSLINVILSDLDTVIDRILQAYPNLTIYLPMYDFPNFEEAINSILIPNQHPQYNVWDRMEKPNFQQINEALMRFAHKTDSFAQLKANVYFTNAAGAMQYYYGQDSPLSVSPGGTYPQYTAPIPGGYINYPSPVNAFTKYLLFYDAFHLSDGGNDRFYEYHFENWYWDYLRRGADTSLQCDAANSGTVNASAQSNNYCKISSSGDDETLLSFSTSIPVGMVISEATLFIKRDSLIGQKPLNGAIKCAIVNGNFGSSSSLDAQDFFDNGDFEDTLCTYGNLPNDRSWLRIPLSNSFLNNINNSGITQFKLGSIELNSGDLFFSNNLHTARLDLSFQNVVGQNESLLTKTLDIFPNPIFNNHFTISNLSQKDHIRIVDIQGKELDFERNNSNFTLNSASPGIFMVLINDLAVGRLIVQ